MHAARLLLAAGVLCLIPACQNEPDFEERYEAAEETIRAKAAEIDSALAKAERERERERRETPTPEQRSASGE